MLQGGPLEYTFLSRGACSRLDRFYVPTGGGSVFSLQTVPVGFSDHCMVVLQVGIRSQVRVGRGWWKLNCGLLKCPVVCAQFRARWAVLAARKGTFPSVLEWWEWAKVECRSFFRVMAKREASGRFGLLRVLQARLFRLYGLLNQGLDRFREISVCKDLICGLREEMAEGVRVRAGVEERLCGEKLSQFLLRRERVGRASVLLAGLHRPDGSVLSDTGAILHYVRGELESLYGVVAGDEGLMESFLQHCAPGLSGMDCVGLVREVSPSELWEVVRSFRRGKVPGSDGFPMEFYVEFWDVLGADFLEVARFCLRSFLCPFRKMMVLCGFFRSRGIYVFLQIGGLLRC